MHADHPDGLGDLIEEFDHVAFAVQDVVSGSVLIRHLGGRFYQGADSPWGGFRWVQFHMPGGMKIELIAPVTDDCFLHQFLATRGEGVHHLTFKVTDLDAAVERARELGYRVVGHAQVHEHWAEAFLHPATAGGTVIQLAKSTFEDEGGSSDWEAVIAGHVIEGA